MGKRIDLTGQRFGRLMVEGFAYTNKQGVAHWYCRCDCGKTAIVRTANLRNGNTTSCGCARMGMNSTHRKSRTRIYRIWAGMVKRTENQNNRCYSLYGGRGIRVCGEWRSDFTKFYEWSMLNGYSDGLTIDRIDSDKDYSPDNCRWATSKQQARNTSRNILLEYKGEIKPLGEWAELFKIKPHTLHKRLKLGWNVEKALETPVKKNIKHK